MNESLAQSVALISYGNEYLNNGNVEDNFYPCNSTFKHYNSVQYVDFNNAIFRSQITEVMVAQSPIGWFKLLKKGGCKKLALNYHLSKDQSFTPDYKLMGFGTGGGPWLIEAIYDEYSNYWVNKSEVTKRDDPAKKFWSIKYGVIAKNKPIIDMHYDLIETRNNLDAVLLEIKALASRHSLDYWADVFQKAQDTLKSPNPNREYYHKDLIIAKNYSLAAQQLLFAAGLAFVFGGMGSWNDLAFEMEDENEMYRSLSSKLYNEINKSIIAAVNKIAD
ncbi:MAG: hypothetical protein ACHQHN_02865 [Sphingobacteriales bacterium]